MALYHCAISSLVLDTRGFSPASIGEICWFRGMPVRLTCHMSDVPGK